MCLSYIGGKSTIAPSLIIPNIPKDIELFSEVFGGMMWTFFKMDIKQFPNLKKVVYNDFNPLNYNLFQCLRNPEELLKAVNSIPCQEKGISPTPLKYSELFKKFQSEIFHPDFTPSENDYYTAAKYAYIISQVFSGLNPSKNSFVDLKGKYKSKYLTFRDKLTKPDWVDHFLKITDVENMDFEDFIKKYDHDKAYFYCDPPYYNIGEKYYANHEFGIETHQRLANVLQNIQGMFSLSYYDFPQLSEWFPKNEYRWKAKQFAKAAMASSGKSQVKGTELLIMNY